MNFNIYSKKIILGLTITSIFFSSCTFAANYIYQNNMSSNEPGITNETEVIPIIIDDESTKSEIEDYRIATTSVATKSYFVHDGVIYRKGESMGQFKLSGFCACKICGTGTGLTASGKPVRENHTIAADWNVLPKGTVIILENAIGKDGTSYDGVYVVEDRGGGVKNNHIDIYRPTHELAKLVTLKGRAYGDVYIAEKVDEGTYSNIN